ncbi:HD domain-containing phosphohydrolase [Undibacterium sp. RuRC25W]|uniref:HD domain-containing phosphohydrolase n=1 Tax=Undibacterium sp. RuRC25W TaxID=3413047 RepID=UPI003BF06959
MKLDIVAIDDSSVNLFLTSHLIRQFKDCILREFNNPQKALTYCVEHIPDLVIVDFMMPEMDGIEFIRRFRALPGREDIPVLMVTANDQTEIRYRALEAGANDFLNKPIDKIEFSARTRNMLSLRRSQRKLLDIAEWLTDEVRLATAEILARERETIIRLSKAADSRDPETGAHILRMSHFCKLIAAHLGLSEENQQILLDAAPMHDVGKVGIPDHILLKPGRLDVAEFDIMKRHSFLGYEILNGSQSVILQTAAQIALSHHEKFDGSGYPHGLAGDAIPLFARICAVADVFDALTSERPYKKAWTDSQAIAYLQEGRGQHFDPACVDAFLENWDEVMQIRHRFKDG